MDELSSYFNDKRYKYQPTQSGESDCCGAPVIDDYVICSECNEHCDYAPELCGYCGDVEVDSEVDGGFCCDDCWRGYEAEAFKEKC